MMKKKILLIITGGIAAYKSLDLIRKFREEGCDITCILTKSGSEFVTPLSIESLSENRVETRYASIPTSSKEQLEQCIILQKGTYIIFIIV